LFLNGHSSLLNKSSTSSSSSSFSSSFSSFSLFKTVYFQITKFI
jgi:hypothetical protein